MVLQRPGIGSKIEAMIEAVLRGQDSAMRSCGAGGGLLRLQ